MREELYHPLVAHFPIVIFFIATIFKGMELITFSHHEWRERINFFGRFFLFAGPLFFLVTMYLGDTALDIVKKDFCDIGSLYAHEEAAKNALIFIIIATILESLSQVKLIKEKYFKPVVISTFLTLVIANIIIFKTAHSGAMIVYNQGAAVKTAPVSCHR